ncbi:unnamed protein product [Prorocentrum cordatum]|uniref:Uncharacterized protein n=1 Tax=Prorocentrum cordatum TaxID=2364126 RepID=A0ABN9TLY1_9DINO|nr:unnamed protein product [Polarella glacialis]
MATPAIRSSSGSRTSTRDETIAPAACPRGKPSPSELLAQGKDPGVYGGAEAAQLPGQTASTSRAQQPAAARGAQEARPAGGSWREGTG